MMIPQTDLIGFIFVATMLVLTPGADTVLVATAAARSTSAGHLTAAGIICGCMTWGALAAFGLAALTQSFPTAFIVLKFAGAAYLAWIGFRYILSDGARVQVDLPFDLAHERGFKDGFLTNILNPKIGLFYLTILPQFTTSVKVQTSLLLLLAIVHSLLGALYFLILVWGVARFSRSPAMRSQSGRMEKIAGVSLIALALHTALAG